ncbi:hypothetical protein MMC13_001250 [Lambiella insularis]|nr:hypothetical protein [Lambiella insularis]
MSVEDGAALGVLLSNLTSRDDLQGRLKLFEDLRKERVSVMQIFSSAGREQSAKIADEARKYYQGHLPTNHEEYDDFCNVPNVMRDAMEVLAKHQAQQSGHGSNGAKGMNGTMASMATMGTNGMDGTNGTVEV